MEQAKTTIFLQRAVEKELNFCRLVNHTFRAPVIQGFFAIISRLGDGILWYSLIASLPLIYGADAIRVSLLMVAVGIADLVIYKLLKKITCRQRPCNSDEAIVPGARLLDHYSFPSGHTLHAVAFTIIAVSFFPALGWVLIPFAALVAMSRVILGLHFPTDVIAGALIATLIATVSLSYF